MELLVAVFFTCLLKESFSDELITSILKRKFRFDLDSVRTKCNNDEADAVLKSKNNLINENEKISSIIKERIMNQTSWTELDALTNEYCDKNENLKSLSQKLVEDFQKCVGHSFKDAEKWDLMRELVSNSCASIYNEHRSWKNSYPEEDDGYH